MDDGPFRAGVVLCGCGWVDPWTVDGRMDKHRQRQRATHRAAGGWARVASPPLLAPSSTHHALRPVSVPRRVLPPRLHGAAFHSPG